MFMFITSVLRCIENIYIYCFVGVHFVRIAPDWLWCMSCTFRCLQCIWMLSEGEDDMSAIVQAAFFLYAGNAGRRGLHAQGRHLHPSLECGSLNTLLVLRALDFFVLQSLSGFCLNLCVLNPRPQCIMELANQTLAQNLVGLFEWDFKVFFPQHFGVQSVWRTRLERTVCRDVGFDSRCCSLRSKLLKICFVAVWRGPAQDASDHNWYSWCFNMFQYVSICFNMFQYVSLQSRHVDMLISLGSWVPVFCAAFHGLSTL